MVNEITLYAVAETSREGGTPTVSRTGTVVYADMQSVRRQEFYAAESAGRKADIVLVVNADEYSEQTEVLCEGKRYRVVRAYRVGMGRVELTCERID